MMVRGLALPLLLAACVSTEPSANDMTGGLLGGTPIEIEGKTLVARQMRDWPKMIFMGNPVTNEMEVVERGTAATVIVSGSPDSRDWAIAALARFCGRKIDPIGFDTQYVHQDPKTGDWWFDGFCG